MTNIANTSHSTIELTTDETGRVVNAEVQAGTGNAKADTVLQIARVTFAEFRDREVGIVVFRAAVQALGVAIS